MPRALLKKAKGLWSCMSTTPIPLAEASVSNTNSLLKSGRANTGALLIAILRAWNASVASGDQINAFFLTNLSMAC
jgi:hypothetical protein